MAGVSDALLAPLEALYGLGWELRRRARAAGWTHAARIAARVVSVGNLTTGGTGKTTLALHLARLAGARGLAPALVCRRWKPGPGGAGDEELMYRAALGAEAVYAGRSKRDAARAAAAAGRGLVIVDDGFSHWPLARDVDVVLLDARDLFGGDRLLPRGRLREPHRALQRADAVVVTRLDPDEDPAPWLERVRPYAPAARLAAGRHAPVGVTGLSGDPRPAGRARIVTGTGNPAAVERSALDAGFEVVGLAAYPDHHWFTRGEAGRELARARAARASVLVTAKDAVRWPDVGREEVSVLEVEWAWVTGGDSIEALCLGERP